MAVSGHRADSIAFITKRVYHSEPEGGAMRSNFAIGSPIVTLTFVLCLSTATRASSIEWKIADGGNGHLYEAILVGGDISWEDAQAAVAARGPGWHLATLTSAAENSFVEALFAGDTSFFHCCIGIISSGPWVGAFSSTNASNDWHWVTGEPFIFEDWGPNEPFGNGNRISYAAWGSGVAWNDIPSGHPLSPRSYIAEFSEPIPEPSTLSLLMSSLVGVFWWKLSRRIESKNDSLR
jgi:hypothetical protein